MRDAEEAYINLRDKIGADSDEVLLGAKAEFMAHLITVIQFQQQMYKKSAKRGEKLDSVLEQCGEAQKQKPKWWGDIDFATHKDRVEEDGGDDNARRSKQIKKEGRDRGGRNRADSRDDRRRRGRRKGDRRSDDDDDDEDDDDDRF